MVDFLFIPLGIPSKVDFDVTYLQQKIDKDNKGGFMHQALEAMSKYESRSVIFQKSPYYLPPNTVFYESKRVQLMDQTKIKLRNTEAFKYFIAAFGPVAVALPMHDCWKSITMEHYRRVDGKYLLIQPVNLEIDSKNGNHYMVLYGFEYIENDTYFACKNSYGESFGTNGEFYIKIHEALPLMDVTPLVAIWSKNQGLGEKIIDKDLTVAYEAYEDFFATFQAKMFKK